MKTLNPKSFTIEGKTISYTVVKNPMWNVIQTYGTPEDREQYKYMKQEVSMTRDEFKKLIGEDPIDLIGPDWENEVKEWDQEKEDLSDHLSDAGYMHEGHLIGNCYVCRRGI